MDVLKLDSSEGWLLTSDLIDIEFMQANSTVVVATHINMVLVV